MQEKYIVTFSPELVKKSFPKGTTLLDALIDMEIPVPTPCGGKGICKKCIVHIHGQVSHPGDHEAFLSGDTYSGRLSCQCTIEGDVTVDHIASVKDVTYSGSGLSSRKTYYIAVDLGTTSVYVSFTESETLERVALLSFLNPQRRYGHDVISRISASNDKDKFIWMTDHIRHGVFDRIAAVLSDKKMNFSHIEKITVTGNTTMTYLFLGIDVSPLGVHPHTAKLLSFEPVNLNQLYSLTDSTVPVTALPVHSAFIGGDVLGGTGLVEKEGVNETYLFIDLGTNGEIVLKEEGRPPGVTSCAMGPALEGMNISCGMTATEGAICSVAWDESDYLKIETIGGTEPLGFCGTGLIDAVAFLLNKGGLAEDGSFLLEAISKIEGLNYSIEQKAIFFTERVFLTQKDIRTVQLAKGACQAAVILLLQEMECQAINVKKVFIAGAFGEYLNMHNFIRLKFLPELPNALYESLGNSSLLAAEVFGYNNNYISYLSWLQVSAKELKLAMHRDFQDLYLQSLHF